MIPRIKINFANGQLGKIAPSLDGQVALVCGATAQGETFVLGVAYKLTRLSDLVELGVNAVNNPRLHKHVSDYYSEAPEGTPLTIYGVDKTKTMTELCDKDTGAIRALIESEGGALRAIFVGRESNSSVSVTKGIDPDVLTALPKAQALAEYATTELYAPVFFVLEGRDYSGKGLEDLSKQAYNRVGVMVGDTDISSRGAAIGLLAAKVATTSVQRNIGRVKDGALKVQEVYIAGAKLEEKNALVGELHEKRYISLRRYVGRTGYFFADDNLACQPVDDYAQITARRVIDKAYRIAYNALLEMELDEMELNSDGTVNPALLTAWEMAIERAINTQMTARGELSGEDAVKCEIDRSLNLASSSEVVVSLGVRPHGYARYINLSLGFSIISNTEKQ